jgi:hypothetical protein
LVENSKLDFSKLKELRGQAMELDLLEEFTKDFKKLWVEAISAPPAAKRPNGKLE